jgi:hypothetical protein
MVCITPRSVYPRGTKSRYPLNRSLVGPHSRAGLLEKRRISCPPVPGLNPVPFRPYPSRHTDYAIAAPMNNFVICVMISVGYIWP